MSSPGRRTRRAGKGERHLGAILTVCAALVSCGGAVTFVYQQYDGPSLPVYRIAIVRQTGTSPTILVSVDGKPILAPLESQNRLHVEVLPGLHEIDVAAPSLGLTRAMPVRVMAEAGKVYRVEVSGASAAPPPADNGEPPLEVGEWVAHVYEVDRETDAPQRNADVPAPPSTPRPAAAPVGAMQVPDAGSTGGGVTMPTEDRDH